MAQIDATVSVEIDSIFDVGGRQELGLPYLAGIGADEVRSGKSRRARMCNAAMSSLWNSSLRRQSCASVASVRITAALLVRVERQFGVPAPLLMACHYRPRRTRLRPPPARHFSHELRAVCGNARDRGPAPARPRADGAIWSMESDNGTGDMGRLPSRYFIRPSRTQVETSRMKSP
jgi:hypothetical protein